MVTDSDRSRLARRYQLPRHTRSGMPSGYSASPRSFTVPTPARACWAKGSDRRGDQAGENQALVNGWIPWVLVDNKLVAEIGERHLVWRWSSSLR
jgi:hypothetical protein